MVAGSLCWPGAPSRCVWRRPALWCLSHPPGHSRDALRGAWSSAGDKRRKKKKRWRQLEGKKVKIGQQEDCERIHKNVNIEMAYFESLLPSATLCRARLTLNQLIYSYKQSRHLFIAAFFFLNQQPLLISTVNHLLQMKCEENNKRGQDSLSRQRLWDDERYL